MEAFPIFFIGVSVCWYALRAYELLRHFTPPTRLQRLLGYIFIWWGLSTLKDLLLYLPGGDTKSMLSHIFFIDGCGALTFALLIFEFTMPGWVNCRRTVWMSVPFVAFLVIHIFFEAEWLSTLYTVFFVSFAWGIYLTGLYKGIAYSKAIRQNYSNLEDVDISWMGYIFVAFFICQHVWWAIADDLTALGDTLYYILSLLCWHFTFCGINRLRPTRLPAPEPIVNTATTQKRYSNILAGRLEQLMDEDKLYLNPELTTSDITARLNTNRTYLSEYLSTELHTTFYDYINRLRIERSVIPMMKSHPDVSLEYIAIQSGFKSITTFRRAFRKITGVLPGEYMRQ